MNHIKKIILGVHDFEDLRSRKGIYVDKTKHIYNLLTEGSKFYFISRPRRFGKSLLLTTVKKIYEGKKEIFEGLWIYSSDYHWKKHPVLSFDMTMPIGNTLEDLISKISQNLQMCAKSYSIEIDNNKPLSVQIREFFEKANTQWGKVVLLIDEYDNPLHSFFDSEVEQKKIHNFLHTFYSAFKELSAYIEFSLITGISKIGQISLFSGMNMLVDISMHENYSTLLGYTQKDLENYYFHLLDNVSKKLDLNRESLIEKLRYWYNGYQFSPYSIEKIYNPFSVILFFYNLGRFSNYWFSTGNSFMIYKILKKKNIDINKIENMDYNVETIDVDVPDYPKLSSLLFQSGYLTISDFCPKTNTIKLGFPNYEVRSSFFTFYLEYFSGEESYVFKDLAIKAKDFILHGKMENFFSTLKEYLLLIPYPLQAESKEGYYHSLLYVFVSMLGQGVKCGVEELTNLGRLDLFIETEKQIYICELKLNSSPQSAIKQIRKKRYFEKFLGKGKDVFLVGMTFDEKLRNLSKWKIEKAE